jgi:hypothetical protein
VEKVSALVQNYNQSLQFIGISTSHVEEWALEFTLSESASTEITAGILPEPTWAQDVQWNTPIYAPDQLQLKAFAMSPSTISRSYQYPPGQDCVIWNVIGTVIWIVFPGSRENLNAIYERSTPAEASKLEWCLKNLQDAKVSTVFLLCMLIKC